MTNVQIVSDIITDMRAKGVDDRLSERYILSMLRRFNALFLKRENDQLRLYKYDIWTPIDCLKMIQSDVSECSGIKKVNRYMRSVEKIPELYSYSNGPLFKEVISLDDHTMYHSTSLKEYRSKMNREFKPREKFCWIRDGYLIIPDGPEEVSLLGCFIDPSLARQVSKKTDCVYPMQEEFSCPPHLIEVVKEKVLERLMNVYRKNIVDEVADLDTNNKEEKKNAR